MKEKKSVSRIITQKFCYLIKYVDIQIINQSPLLQIVDLKGKKDISHELQLLTSIGRNLFGTVLYQLSWDATGNKRFTFVSPNVKAYTGTSPEDIIQDPSIL